MNRFFVLVLLAVALMAPSCQSMMRDASDVRTITSPDGSLLLTFSLSDGIPTYSLEYGDKVLLEPSRMGFEFKNLDPMVEGFQLGQVEESTFIETWETVWGERRVVKNHYNELKVSLLQGLDTKRELEIYFRVFDDGLGFRYVIPDQPGINQIEIISEETEFNFAEDHLVWYQPCDTIIQVWEDGYNSYERLYQSSQVSGLTTLMHTPATFEMTNGMYLSIHEAGLIDYTSMVLARGAGMYDLKCDLVPWPDGVKVKTAAPMQTPWRTIQVSKRVGGLAESDLILNLNEPNQLTDVSWVKPMKYLGIWWEMHLNKSTWEYGPRHGANTENVKRYIDFAAENGFGGVLVEGWNTGWDVWTTQPNFDFVTPYPDFDLDGLSAYAREKGVGLVGHHETSGDALAYEKQMPAAFRLLEEKGIGALKTGYVGAIKPEGQNHHGQWMVNHYRRVLELAARHKVSVVAHEPIKPTGERRTYPNMLSREAVRGMEYNAWSTGNPPSHTTILPFTMLLAGPLDYTPGIFQADLDQFRKGNSIHTTVANQLALYVVIYSPVQMAADLPEHYEGNEAFQFIRDVVTDWEESRVLDAKIGDYVAIARKERSGENWFLGAVTDENARELEVDFSFLDNGKAYVAEIYADAENASFDRNPMAVEIRKYLVDRDTKYQIKLAPGGGQAIRFRPATGADEGMGRL